MIEQYGLRDPAPVQYFRWIGKIFRGDLGYSTTADGPVLRGFGQFFPTTLELVLFATPLIILVGLWLGTLGAVKKDRPVDHAIRVVAIIGYSLPTFWLGLLLLMFFYGFLGIFPPGTISEHLRDVVYGEGWIRSPASSPWTRSSTGAGTSSSTPCTTWSCPPSTWSSSTAPSSCA